MDSPRQHDGATLRAWLSSHDIPLVHVQRTLNVHINTLRSWLEKDVLPNATKAELIRAFGALKELWPDISPDMYPVPINQGKRTYGYGHTQRLGSFNESESEYGLSDKCLQEVNRLQAALIEVQRAHTTLLQEHLQLRLELRALRP